VLPCPPLPCPLLLFLFAIDYSFHSPLTGILPLTAWLDWILAGANCSTLCLLGLNGGNPTPHPHPIPLLSISQISLKGFTTLLPLSMSILVPLKLFLIILVVMVPSLLMKLVILFLLCHSKILISFISQSTLQIISKVLFVI
jgi:hypothetical protein